MCGRFAQYEPRSHYIEALNPNVELALAIDEVPIDRYKGSVWISKIIVR